MSTSSTPAVGYTPPKGEWERREPESQGFDTAALAEALKFAEATEIEWPRDLHDRAPKGENHPNDRALGPLKIRSAPAGLVIRGGYIVGEYGDPSSVEVTFSCTKSYIATLAGQAVDKDLIHSMDDRVSGYIDDGGFDSAFAFVRSASRAYLDAYFPILLGRAKTPYGDRERQFQLYRRGRYVEFNLLQDRGTRFGIEAGARTESVLASMPPLVRWEYDFQPEPGSAEAKLMTDFLRPRDWLR